MLGSEYKAIYEAANDRRKQAEQVASSISRLDDLKRYHLYVGLVSLMGDQLAVSMYKDTPNWTHIVDESYGTMIDNNSKEVLRVVNLWAEGNYATLSPDAVDQEFPREEPPSAPAQTPKPQLILVPTPPAFQLSTWMWWALGIVAIGGSVAAIVAFPPMRVGRHRGMM